VLRLLFKGIGYDIDSLRGEVKMKANKRITLSKTTNRWILIFLSSWFLLGGVFGHAPIRSETSQKEINEVIVWLDNMVDELEGVERYVPGDTFDCQEVIQEVGSDPIKLFEWVRENTFWAPYQGSLRGATGVLMDRLGSSLDRALLLGSLLSSAGEEVRIAHARLTGSQASDLWEQIKKIRDTRVLPQTVQVEYDVTRIETIARRLELDPQELRQGIEQLSRMNLKDEDEAKKRVKKQAEMLMETLSQKMELDDESAKQRCIEALRDHWWVQYESEEGWIDLDPVLLGHMPGEVLTDIDETFGIEDLDEDLFHMLTIRVLVEQWEDNRLNEHTVLEYSLKPSEHFGKRIILQNLAMDWPGDLQPEGKEFSKRLRDAILDGKEWMPVLEIGNDMIVQRSFTVRGGINDSPNPTPEAKTGRTTRGLMGGMAGGLTGGSRKEEDKKEGYLTAGWLEYDIRSPGREDRTIRREIFDLLGPASRAADDKAKPEFNESQRLERGYSLFGIIDILPVVCQVSSQFVNQIATRNLLDQLRFLREELKRDNLEKMKDLNSRIGMAFEAIQSPLHKWALLRPRWNRYANHVYFDSVNIVNLRTRIAEDVEGELMLRRTFDVVTNSISVNPRVKISPALVRINQGVADTLSEAMAVPGPEPHMNVSYLVDLAKNQGIDWRLVNSFQDNRWEKWRLSEDIRQRIENSLAKGWSVVVPERPLVIEGKTRLGWWRIDLRNGETLGVMDTGFHQDTTEYSEQQWLEIRGRCTEAINNLHKATRGTNAPPLPPNMSFADFIEMLNYQNWKYLDPERVLRLWELAKMSGALAGL
jgi:transposase-like protein